MDGDRPWAGRRLHFVGIGGAGMSGLALVAHALGAEVTGSDRAAGRRTRARCGPPASSRRRPRRRQRAAGAEVGRLLERDPGRQPRARGGARARAARAAPRRPARRDQRADAARSPLPAPTARRRPPSMVVHALRGCGHGPGLPGRRRGALAPAPTPAGGRASGSWSRPTSPTGRCSKLAPRRSRSLTNAELDHHTTYGSQRDVERDVPRVPRARGARGRLGPARAAGARATVPVVAFDVPDVELHAGGSRFELARARGRARRARRSTTRSTPRGARRRAGSRAPTRRARPRRSPTSAAPAGASSASARPPPARSVVDDYAHHPTEVARDDRGRPHARSRARDRRLPAAPVLAHRRAGARVRPRAGARRPRRSCSRSTRRASAPRTSRASAGLLVAEAAADAAGGRTVAWLPGFDDAERYLRGVLREGDLCLVHRGRRRRRARAPARGVGGASRRGRRARIERTDERRLVDGEPLPATAGPAARARPPAPHAAARGAGRLPRAPVACAAASVAAAASAAGCGCATPRCCGRATSRSTAPPARARAASGRGARDRRARDDDARTSARARCGARRRAFPSGAGTSAPPDFAARAARSQVVEHMPVGAVAYGRPARPGRRRRHAAARRPGRRPALADDPGAQPRGRPPCWRTAPRAIALRDRRRRAARRCAHGSRRRRPARAASTVSLRDGPRIYFGGRRAPGAPSGRRRSPCWPTRAPAARATSTSGSPSARRRAARRRLGPDRRPHGRLRRPAGGRHDRPTTQTDSSSSPSKRRRGRFGCTGTDSTSTGGSGKLNRG